MRIYMAAGHRAPAVAPDAQAVPVYAAAGVNAAVTIGSYAGAVVSEPDETLFGAICGIDPDVRTDDPAFAAAGPVLQLLGQLLTMVLAANRERDVTAEEVAAARRDAETDVLTGLANRRAWERLVDHHSERFARMGRPDGGCHDRPGHAQGHQRRTGPRRRRRLHPSGGSCAARHRPRQRRGRAPGWGRVRPPPGRLHRVHGRVLRAPPIRRAGSGRGRRLRRVGT